MAGVRRIPSDLSSESSKLSIADQHKRFRRAAAILLYDHQNHAKSAHRAQKLPRHDSHRMSASITDCDGGRIAWQHPHPWPSGL